MKFKQIYLLLGFIFTINSGLSVAQSTYKVSGVKSTIFSLQINGNELFTEQYKTYHYASLQTNAAFNVILGCSEIINEIKVSPATLRIAPLPDKRTVSFRLPGPGYYVIRINGTQKLFIFAESPDKKPVTDIILATDLGIDNHSGTVQTSAIQKALETISGSGKILVFPAGIYKTGSLSISSNTRIYLDEGALLKGTDNLEYFIRNDKIRPAAFIRIKDAENIKIFGRGIIDGNGRYLRDRYGDSARMRLILVLNSKNVTIDGVFLRDPGSWNTHILFSENVIIRNIKMLNDIDLSNTDGFDPDASRKVLIENCFAYCSDDNVAVKTTGSSGYLQDVKDITVRGCVFLTKKSSLKVGTESRGKVMEDILFENNDVIESDRGMSLYCSDGAAYKNIRYINNRFEDNYPDAKRSGMNFTIIKRNESSKPGTMTTILIKDCTFLKPFPRQSEISGFDDSHKIFVTFENLVTGGKKCTTPEDAGIKANRFTVLNFR